MPILLCSLLYVSKSSVLEIISVFALIFCNYAIFFIWKNLAWRLALLTCPVCYDEMAARVAMTIAAFLMILGTACTTAIDKQREQ